MLQLLVWKLGSFVLLFEAFLNEYDPVSCKGETATVTGQQCTIFSLSHVRAFSTDFYVLQRH